MTKTKRQLRAEAVERLKNMGPIMYPSELLEAVHPYFTGWNQARSALIDLLTDGPNDELAPESGVSAGGAGSNDGVAFADGCRDPEVTGGWPADAQWTTVLLRDVAWLGEGWPDYLSVAHAEGGEWRRYVPESARRTSGARDSEADTRECKPMRDLMEECAELERIVGRLTAERDEWRAKAEGSSKVRAGSSNLEWLMAEHDQQPATHAPETADTCNNSGWNVGHDTREKLEADVRNLLFDAHTEAWMWGHENERGTSFSKLEPEFLALLDRQAAITERRWMEICGANANVKKQLEHDVEMWRDRSEDMRMERDELERKLEKAWEYGEIWPRFDDGGYVEIGAEVTDSRGSAMKVGAVMFYADGYTLYRYADRPERPYGHREKHPPVKAHDGQPIKIGQTLYGLSDGKAWTVDGLNRKRPWSVWAHCGERHKCLKPEWLVHELPDSWERILQNACANDWPLNDGEMAGLVARCEKLAKEGA